MEQNDRRGHGSAGVDLSLEDDGEIIELTERVTDEPGPRPDLGQPAAGTLSDIDEELIELTDRVLSEDASPESPSTGRVGESARDNLIDTLDLDEAMRSLDDRLDDDSGPSNEEHLGFTTTLDDTMEFDEGILDLSELDETVPGEAATVEEESVTDLTDDFADDLFEDEFDPAALEQAMDDELITGLSSEPKADAASIESTTGSAESVDSEIPAGDLTETIELDDLIASDLSELEGIEEPLSEDLLQGLNLDEELDAENEQQSAASEEIIEKLGMEIEPPARADALSEVAANVAEQAPPLPVFSQIQLEQALVKAIREVYADRIEGLLVAAIEKTVAHEISRLKARLMDDSSNDER